MSKISDERLAFMLTDAIGERDRPIIGDGSLYDFAPSELVEALTELQALRSQPAGVRVKGLDHLNMARDLIREAKGFEGTNGGSVTNHLDAAENWLDEVEIVLTAALERP